GDDLLAPLGRLASGGRGETTARQPAGALGRPRPDRLDAGGCGEVHGAGAQRGAKTGPNPTDRRRAGSKHHLLTDACGVPLASTLTGANVNDITQLLALLEVVPPVRGKGGPPRRRPK